MGIIAAIRDKPKVGISVAAAFFTIAIVFFAFNLFGSGKISASQPKSFYFTSDDGATLFPDDSSKIAPFDHDGQPAVQAHVFECHGKRFVGYLERAKNDAAKPIILQFRKDIMQQAVEHPGSLPDAMQIAKFNNSVEIKRPGDSQWLRGTSSAVGPIRMVPMP